MKIFKSSLFIALVIGLLASSCTNNSGGSSDLSNVKVTNELDSVSYALGVLLSPYVKDFDELNMIALAKGMQEAKLDLTTTMIQQEECNVVVNKYFAKSQEAKYKGNIEIGEKFLAENGQRGDIVTLQSGLQYEVLTEGTGAKPTRDDRVKVHYHGTVIDGTVFDSSVDRGTPAEFGVTQVIPGWTEALQLMPVGSKWKLYVPQNLAYASQSPSPAIEPYSTLIFEVELLDILDAPAPALQ